MGIQNSNHNKTAECYIEPDNLLFLFVFGENNEDLNDAVCHKMFTRTDLQAMLCIEERHKLQQPILENG